MFIESNYIIFRFVNMSTNFFGNETGNMRFFAFKEK